MFILSPLIPRLKLRQRLERYTHQRPHGESYKSVVISHIKAKIEWVKSPNVLSGLILFFASLLFFYDIFTGRFLFTERDLGPYFIPPRFFWVESIKGGDFPLWNPFQFS